VKKKKIKILISAGPTREPIDAVRFISNYSTATFGFKIAFEAKKRGHKVTLVSGPTHLEVLPGVKLVRTETALEMKKALSELFKRSDCLIMNAAVCDYRPSRLSKDKIKKGKKSFSIKLIKNPDILKELSGEKNEKIIIGFAVETRNLISNAFHKLRKKNLDFIIASKITGSGSPFGKGRINAYFIDRQGRYQKMVNTTKQNLSQKLLDRVEALCYTKSQK
jgi:phosphopantothenoylcysteine decarboxylase/phosphopantothenate--cysteine ligase